MFDRNFFIGFGIGVVAGVLGLKFYKEHQQGINSRLSGLSGLYNRFVKAGEQDMDLNDLEAQKEHLEDLIAEARHKAGQSENA